MASPSAPHQQHLSRVRRSITLLALVAVAVTCDKAAPTDNSPYARTAPPATVLAPGALKGLFSSGAGPTLRRGRTQNQDMA